MSSRNATQSGELPFNPRVWLALEGVDPAEVESALGLASDYVPSPQVIRDLEMNGERYSSWILDTHGHVKSNRLAEHLDWIVARVSPKETEFVVIAASAERAQIMVYGAPTNWELDSVSMNAISARLGAELVFCVTHLGNP